MTEENLRACFHLCPDTLGGALKDLYFFSWGGRPPLKSAAVAASASQIGTSRPSRLLSQPPPVTVGRQAAAIAAFEWHGGLGKVRESTRTVFH